MLSKQASSSWSESNSASLHQTQGASGKHHVAGPTGATIARLGWSSRSREVSSRHRPRSEGARPHVGTPFAFPDAPPMRPRQSAQQFRRRIVRVAQTTLHLSAPQQASRAVGCQVQRGSRPRPRSRIPWLSPMPVYPTARRERPGPGSPYSLWPAPAPGTRHGWPIRLALDQRITGEDARGPTAWQVEAGSSVAQPCPRR